MKEGFPEGSSEYLKWVSPLFPEFAEPKVEPCRNIALHFLCIFLKAFRAVCKVLIDPCKIPAAFITLSWHGHSRVTAGLQYRRRCPAAAEREGSEHRAALCFCSQTHVLGKKLMCKWDRLCPASPALLLFLKIFHQAQEHPVTVPHTANSHS